MNVQYLRRMIRDQIERAQSLEGEIPRSPRHAALERLAASCKRTLEEQICLLREALAILDAGDMSRIAEVVTAVKHSAREIGTVEGYGMPPLHCQSEQAVFLNGVLSTIHSEVGLPFPCPAVSCTSNDYYFSYYLTNTVYVPLSEAAFLLHMPDFYHELGHLLLSHPSREEKSRLSLAGAANAVGVVDDWYLQRVGTEGCTQASVRTRDGMKWMRSQWKLKWVQEAFCDLFALFATGPAYAYSNLHLVSKREEDMYGLCLFGDQDHPADEARMRLLDAGMRLLGHGREAQHVRREWEAMAQFGGDPPPEYGHAFPSPLLQGIAEAVLLALDKSGLRGYSGAEGAQGDGCEASVAALLNDAWRGFWDEGDGQFRGLEGGLVAKLASMSRSGTA